MGHTLMIRRFFYGVILSLFSVGTVAAQNDGQRITQRIKCQKDTSQSYALYVPQKYTALLIFLDPAARGNIPVEIYHTLADEYGIIMAGSYNSRNFNGGSSVESFVAIYNDIMKDHVINANQVWIAGFSGGARAAASITMSYGVIKGIIACGAGFANDEEIKTGQIRAYAAIVGTGDMNYSELLDNSSYLDEKKINNVLLTFTGGHSWGPVDQFGLAIEWLISQEKDTAILPTARGDHFLSAVHDKLDSDLLYAAWIDASQLCRLPAYKTQADPLRTEIESRKEFVPDRERFKQADREEQNCMNDFSLAFSGMVYKNETTEDDIWLQKARVVAGMRTDKNKYRQMAAERCFDHCIRTCQEYFFQFFNDANYKMAFNAARVWSLFTPQDPDPYFLMSRSAALTGDKKGCKKLLEEAARKGLVYTNRIARDEALHQIFTTEEIEKIFNKN